MSTAKPLSRFVFIVALVAAAALGAAWPASVGAQCACQLPDNGNGTVDLMPDCSVGYLGHMTIVNGLPGGATIEIDAVLHDFANQIEVPGGTLGGHVQTFDATIQMTMSGTGALAGFNRVIFFPANGEAHSAPRIFGDAVQDFDHDIFRMDGQLFGDPDFCTLEVRAGAFYGYPSPGHTLLTRIGPAGDPFNVDSFFDVAYEIEFVGCPGSILDGMSGITVRSDQFNICGGPVPTQAVSWGVLKSTY